MNSALGALQFFAAFFTGSLALSYAVTKLRLRRANRDLHDLPLETVVRMRADGGVYRSRFLGFSSGQMKFSAPIQRSAYVPIRVGDLLVIEAPLQNRCMVFRTEVLSRDPVSKVFAVRVPHRPSVIDRREEPRNVRFAGKRLELNGDWAELVDLSTNGARVLTLGKHSAGDVIRVKMDFVSVNQLAWVLEVVPAAVQEKQGAIIRLRFLDPIPPIPVTPAESPN